MKKYLIVGLLLLLLASCSSKPVEKIIPITDTPNYPTPMITETLQPSQTLGPSTTATREPVATSVARIRATKTELAREIMNLTATIIALTPSPTPTQTGTSTATQTNTPTPTGTPTVPEATQALMATLDKFVEDHPDAGMYHSSECTYERCETLLSVSPNTEWIAYPTNYSIVHPEFSDINNEGIKVFRLDGTNQWDLRFSELYGRDDIGGSVYIARWSPDDRYLYIVPHPETDGGYAWFWMTGTKLIRFDLITGDWIDTNMGSAFSFSPDGESIVYRSNNSILVYNFQTSVAQSFSVSDEFIDFDRFVWAPDNSQIIFVATREELNKDTNSIGLTTILLSLNANKMQIIVDYDWRFIYPYEWLEKNQVVFYSVFDSDKYQMDLETGEFILMEP